jgi:hypothetical protein
MWSHLHHKAKSFSLDKQVLGHLLHNLKFGINNIEVKVRTQIMMNIKELHILLIDSHRGAKASRISHNSSKEQDILKSKM